MSGGPKVDGSLTDSAIGRRKLLKIGGGFLLGGCTPLSRGGAAFEPAMIDWGKGAHVKGMPGLGINGIRRAIDELIEKHTIPGAVSAVVHRGELVWYEAQGLRDPLVGMPMQRDDIFRIMSSTKPITAVATLMMVEEGRLALDDAVSRFIPSFVNPKIAVAPPGTRDRSKVQLLSADRDITVRDLLTHTSGLVADASAPMSYLVNDLPAPPRGTLSQWVESLGSAALEFQPGTRWQYSPLAGMDTLLRLVEIVSGMPGDVFLRERIFEPLNMLDTFFEVPAAKRDRVVDIFSFSNGVWRPAKETLIQRPPQVPLISGGAGLFSTVRDYMHFQLMLLNGGGFGGRRLLKPETVRMMSTDQVGGKFGKWLPPITQGYGFGLGVRVVEDPAAPPANGRPLGAFGWPGAYSTDAFSAPSADMAAVIFVQVMPTNFDVGTAFGGAVGRAIIS